MSRQKVGAWGSPDTAFYPVDTAKWPDGLAAQTKFQRDKENRSVRTITIVLGWVEEVDPPINSISFVLGNVHALQRYSERLREYLGAIHADAPADEQVKLRAKLRISITWSMQQAKDVVDFCYHAAGTNAIFEKNTFERRFRDIHTVTQQGQAHATNFEFSGQALYGRTPGHRH